MVLFPLICAFLMPITAYFTKEACSFVTLGITGIVFSIASYLAFIVIPGRSFVFHIGHWEAPWGIELIVDPLSALMISTITAFCFLIALYSIKTVRMEVPLDKTGWYYTAYLLLLTGMLGLMLTNDIFNMYVMVEITGICAVALVLARGTKEATEASLKYLLLAVIGSGFILFAIGFLYSVTGNLNLNYIAAELGLVKEYYPYLVWTAMGFFLVGFGIKAALFPLHLWLPDAHSSAPYASSALLSGLVVKVYIISLIRIFYQVFGPDMLTGTPMGTLILILSSMAIVGGSIFAYTQLDLKRRLAYSTVAQVGYIFLGLGLGTSWGLVAALLHVVIHAFMKVGLFMVAGTVYFQTGKKNVLYFSGLGRIMPVSMGAFTIASLSMIGIPLFGGFISKYALAQGSMEAEGYGFVALVVLSGLLNASYYLPIVWQAFFTEEKRETFHLDMVPLSMMAPLLAVTLGLVYLGVTPGKMMTMVENAASVLMLGP